MEYEAVCRQGGTLARRWIVDSGGWQVCCLEAVIELIELIEQVEIWFYSGDHNYKIPETNWCSRRRRSEFSAGGHDRDLRNYSRLRAGSPALRRTGSEAQRHLDETDAMKTSMSAYALRLPASMKAEAEKLAAEDGTSLDRLVATAVAEKVSALRTAHYFTEKKGRADWAAFDQIMRREGSEPPQPGDEIPKAIGKPKE